MKTAPEIPVPPARRTTVTHAAVLALAMLCATTVAAQQRLVVVNGEFLDDNGLAVLDSINCGQTVPDGAYWIDFNASTWGIVGQDIVEPLPDCNAGAAQQAPAQEEADDCESRYSMWEDRMMYCHGVNPN
jgi:hypothetical protein